MTALRLCLERIAPARKDTPIQFELPAKSNASEAAVAAQALLTELGSSDGFDLVFTKKINPGSGVGSSAASCVAAVVGVNHLLGSPFETAALIPYAMEGERIACGIIP